MRLAVLVILPLSFMPHMWLAADNPDVEAGRKRQRSATKLVESVVKSPGCEVKIAGWQLARSLHVSLVYVATVVDSHGDAGCSRTLHLLTERSDAVGIDLVVENKRPWKANSVPTTYDLINDVIPQDGT